MAPRLLALAAVAVALVTSASAQAEDPPHGDFRMDAILASESSNGD